MINVIHKSSIYLLLAVISICCCKHIYAASLFNDGGFESGKIHMAMGWCGHDVKLSSKDAYAGRWSLQLGRAKKKTTCITKPVYVRSGRKYSLTFYAVVSGPGEMNTQTGQPSWRVQHTRHLAGWRVEFQSQDGKKVNRNFSGSFGHIQFTRIIDGQWTKYSQVFYAPKGAATMKIVFYTGLGKNRLRIDNVKVAPLPINGPLNLNPDIALGKFNFSGYSEGDHVRIILKQPDKKDGVLDANHGWVAGDPFPLRGGVKYQVHYRARHPHSAKHRAASIRITFYDAHKKKIGDVKRLRSMLVSSSDWKKKSFVILPPGKTRYARLFLGAGEFDWIRLTKVANSTKGKK